MHNKKYITQAYRLGHKSVPSNTFLRLHILHNTNKSVEYIRVFFHLPKGRKSTGFPTTKIMEGTIPESSSIFI